MEFEGKHTRCLQLTKAIGVRLLFILHFLLAVSRVITILNVPKPWMFSFGALLLILEGLHAVFRRNGLEHKWMSLATLLFIMLDIGPIWIMELNKADQTTGRMSDTSNNTQNFPLTNFIQLDDNVFVYAIEQSFLLVIIIGRWILPKGQMSRDKLSNLLLVMIGKACDITDFFTLFSHKNVALDRTFTYVVLVVWSLSVFQFPISFTESRDNNLVISIHKDRQYMKVVVRTLNLCFKTEIWSILASISMQELPFLICRCYAIGALEIVDDTIIFFLFKNSLIISMYLYRLVSLCLEADPGENSCASTTVEKLEIKERDGIVTAHEREDFRKKLSFDLSANSPPDVPLQMQKPMKVSKNTVDTLVKVD